MGRLAALDLGDETPDGGRVQGDAEPFEGAAVGVALLGGGFVQVFDAFSPFGLFETAELVFQPGEDAPAFRGVVPRVLFGFEEALTPLVFFVLALMSKEAAVTLEGAGLINVLRANDPQIFTDPSSI